MTTYAGCGEKRDGRGETFAFGRVFCGCDACDQELTDIVRSRDPQATAPPLRERWGPTAGPYDDPAAHGEAHRSLRPENGS